MQMTVQQWTSNVKEFRMTEEGHQIWVGLRELVRMVEIESWWDSNPPQFTFPCSLVKGTPLLLILHGCPFPNLLLFRQRRWAEVGTNAIVLEQVPYLRVCPTLHRLNHRCPLSKELWEEWIVCLGCRGVGGGWTLFQLESRFKTRKQFFFSFQFLRLFKLCSQSTLFIILHKVRFLSLA